MKHLVLFVDNFEDVEAIATVDVLLRGGEEVVCSSLMGGCDATSKFGHHINSFIPISSLNLNEFDSLIIPGGPGSFKIMPNLPIVNKIILHFYNNNKLISAICAAPSLLGKLKLLENLEYTVHPGFESLEFLGHYSRDKGVVVTPYIITAKSMYYSIEFALSIYEHFHDKSARDILELSLKGEK